MPAKLQRITNCLWFDDQAEAAVELYTSVFPDSRITQVTRYSKEGAQASGRTEDSVMTVAFELDGQAFLALNGGPVFKFNEAVSLVVNCETQAEIDHYWERLSEGGDEKAQMCGWLKDRFGLSWQVAPAEMPQLMSDPDKAQRVMAAVLQMKKLDLVAMRGAAAGA